MTAIFQRVYTEHIGFVTTDVLPAMAKLNDPRGLLIQVAANMFPAFEQVTLRDAVGPNIHSEMLYTYEPDPQRMGITSRSPLLVMQPKEKKIAQAQQNDGMAKAKCRDTLLFAMMHIGAIKMKINDPYMLDGGFENYLFKFP